MNPISVTFAAASIGELHSVMNDFIIGTSPGIAALRASNGVTITGPGEEPDDGTPANMSSTDATGLPWDARIHLENRKTNADGSWRQKRKLDTTFVTMIESELRGRTAMVPSPTPVMMPPGAMPNGAVPMMAPPGMQPPPMPTVLQPSPIANNPLNDFMSGIQRGLQSNPPMLDEAWITWLNKSLGTANLADLAVRQELIPVAIKLLQDNGRWA